MSAAGFGGVALGAAAGAVTVGGLVVPIATAIVGSRGSQQKIRKTSWSSLAGDQS